jgi:hypothetical protein
MDAYGIERAPRDMRAARIKVLCGWSGWRRSELTRRASSFPLVYKIRFLCVSLIFFELQRDGRKSRGYELKI